jgi:asparagine synthase (glutamine-hydrolysing)
MCGIAGIVDYSSSIDQDKVREMADSIAHRGPDDSGYYFNDNIGLAHRRLSIIDLSDAGHQPMISKCGRYALIYNGELYNYLELKQNLSAKGYEFTSSSDTDVVLNALIEYGVEALSMFNGMYSLALWDVDKERLLLARDRFGIKPLYYYQDEKVLVFGSEIKTIISSGKYHKGTNFQGLHEYMWFGNALGGNTLYEGVSKILPGQYLMMDKSGVSKERYWSIESTPENRVSRGVAIRDVSELLRKSVSRHLLADVPVAVFLSGGIDSSAITALASSEYDRKLQTFAVGFDFDKGVSELEKAKFVANKYKTDHHELHIGKTNLTDTILQLANSHDEPFADAANIPLYLLCNELKNDVKVVLQGDGGDEIFAGYRRYNALSMEKTWMVASTIGLHAQGFLPKAKQSDRLKRFFHAMSRSDPGEKMALLLTHDSYANNPTQLLSDEMLNYLSKSDPFECYAECSNRFKHLDAVQKMLYTDCEILLPNTYLEKVDKSTMANSIEVRVPFLDKDLTDYVMGLPSNYKVKHGQKKWLLRQAMRGIVPDRILDAPKAGFGVPYSTWLKGPLAKLLKEVLFSDTVRNSNYFNNYMLEKKINEHLSGKRNNGFMLWKALLLGLWIIKRKAIL